MKGGDLEDVNTQALEGVPDAMSVSNLTEASLLHTIRVRYNRDEVSRYQIQSVPYFWVSYQIPGIRLFGTAMTRSVGSLLRNSRAAGVLVLLKYLILRLLTAPQNLKLYRKSWNRTRLKQAASNYVPGINYSGVLCFLLPFSFWLVYQVSDFQRLYAKSDRACFINVTFPSTISCLDT